MNAINHENMTMQVMVDGVLEWRPFYVSALANNDMMYVGTGPIPETRDGERLMQLVDGTILISTGRRS